MRFKEFNILSEESSSGFVAVGDSHAAAVAVSGRSAWTNLAVIGASSSGNNSLTSRMLSNISSIPRGAVVLISLGGNDTANSLAGSTPRPPDAIASSVASVVDRVKAKRPAKVIFMLFPVGPGRGGRNRDEEATRKSLEYQEQVRDAIKARVAIGGVEVIDLNGSPLTDGVHATMSTYAGVARRVMGMGTPTVSDTPARNGSGELPVGGGLRAGPPYPSRDEDAVRKMQQTLIRLGYPVGYTGADGKYGLRTQNAVRAFKKDNNISGDGLSMSASDLEKLETAKKVDRPSPTGNDVRGRNRPRGADLGDLGDLASLENIGRAKETVEEFLGKGISDEDMNMLIRATAAEASPNSQERAAVAAVILNRVRSGRFPGSIHGVLTQRNQFQAVTGTSYDPGPSRNFTNMSDSTGAAVIGAFIRYLPDMDKSWLNFTSNNPRAYGRGTNINFMYAMRNADDSRVIGQTVFGTA